ncbi:MAG: hypothetical protein J0L92_23645 [Deltaproteobacteria bacterium]|nr:hypothetical protein [Deltaproteobacteria bacterium]
MRLSVSQSGAAALVLTSMVIALGTLSDVRAQTPIPSVEQRSCDLRATRGYCIGMTAVTPGVEEMLTQCTADGGRPVGVCEDNDTIAYCNLPVTGMFHLHAYHYSGRNPHRWTVDRARADCTRLGGTLQVPSD